MRTYGYNPKRLTVERRDYDVLLEDFTTRNTTARREREPWVVVAQTTTPEAMWAAWRLITGLPDPQNAKEGP